MGNVLILNGSPRAPKSNSRQYAEIFSTNCQLPSDYFNISKNNHAELCQRMSEYSDVLLVFPLYADLLPVGFLNFLKHLEANPPKRKPVVSILINCGFLEHQQNDIALKMLRFFCRKNGYRMGSVLALGSGEAILGTPFRYVAVRAVKKLAKSVGSGSYRTIRATMPLNKRLFLWAATYYWTWYGKRFGTTKEQMQTMKIE